MKRRAFLIAAGAFLSDVRAQSMGTLQALSGARFLADGQEHVLADIIAPPLYRLDEGPPAYFRESKTALQQLLRNGDVAISDVAPNTRWGARVVVAKAFGDAATVQDRLVSEGAARVAPQTDGLERIDRLLDLERTARAEKRGLWAMDEYGIFDAAAAQAAIGAFHLVQGTVARAASAKSRVYLNFGADYRTDFTAGARKALSRKWLRAGVDLAALEGRAVRVRGFVNRINGPSIDLTHVKQIEILNG